jgi:hypothetical protein
MNQPLKTAAAVSAPVNSAALDLVRETQERLAAKVWTDLEISRIPDLSLARFAFEISPALRSKYSSEESFVDSWMSQRRLRGLGTGTQAEVAQDEELKREWRTSPALRAEFRDSFASYSAFRRAERRGGVRIVRSSVVSCKQ